MRNKRLFLAASLGTIIVAVIVAFQLVGGKETQDVYEFGFSGPLTGKQADYGRSVSQGAELRVREINAAGGINGKKIKLVMGDDQATPTQAVTVAHEFASNDRVRIVLGHFNSSCTNAAKPIYKAAKIPQISYGSTNDDVTDGSEWTFRTPYKNSLQGRTLAKFAKQKLKVARVAIVAENAAYGRGLADDFRKAAVSLGLEITAEESYEVEATEYRPLFIKLKGIDVEAMLLAGFHPQIQAMVRQAREIGIRSIFLAGDGVGSSIEYIKNAGPAAEGTYATGPFLMEQNRDLVSRFRTQYQTEFGTMPDSWAAYAYDAVGLAAHATDKTDADRDSIRKRLLALDGPKNAYQGIVGPIYFDSDRNAVNTDVTIAVVKNGRYEVVEWVGE